MENFEEFVTVAEVEEVRVGSWTLREGEFSADMSDLEQSGEWMQGEEEVEIAGEIFFLEKEKFFGGELAGWEFRSDDRSKAIIYKN